MSAQTFFASRDQFGDWLILGGYEGRAAIVVVPPPLSESKAAGLATALNRLVREATWAPKSAGRRSRTKGHSFEREIAKAFRERFPESRRHLENHREDARFGTDIVGIEPFRVQCKKLKKYAPITCIEEVDADRVLSEIPVLVTAGDKQEPMAVLPFEDFLNLAWSYYKDWYPHKAFRK